MKVYYFFIQYYLIIIISVTAVSATVICIPVSAFTLSQQALNQAQQKYGPQAVEKLKAWQNLINANKNTGELRKLRVTTDFFIQFKVVSDEELWQQENYWATPIELIGRNGGDCEDFALAKYFTLKAMGVSIKKMRLVYATSAKLKQPHMILAYYEQPDVDPLILDNLTKWVLYGSERPDLKPVYSFNSVSVWLVKKDQSQEKVSSVKQISLWQTLIEKMQNEITPKEMMQ